MPFTYPYPRPALTVDNVVFALRARDLAVLLVRRKNAPFQGDWALPGGFVDEGEPLHAAALRELEEETGISGVTLEQLGAYGDPGRDPRGHTVSVVFYTFVISEPRPAAGDDAADAAWHPLRSLPIAQPSSTRRRRAGDVKLAFDHARIIEEARVRLQERLHTPSLGTVFRLVPTHFTLTELQRVYEAVFGRTLDKRNFRARLLESKAVKALNARKDGRDQLYRWRP
ncbi:NUDIX domain-containing protein [Pendulispora albinea]|uniref:NUDIX hydrolase n=1 Tax=Pendulispora albinea TaxID=2741071 RepID=A0ABZ2LXZ9_9BACT